MLNQDFAAAAALITLLTAPALAAAQQENNAGTLAPVEVGAEGPADDGYINVDKPASVGKTRVPVERQPFSIETVDRELIEDTGAKNIQDSLLYMSGVYGANFGFDTRGDSAMVRGLRPSLYVDGLRASYGSYNSVRPNIYGLERVEVLKGPSSVLYGQAELGGIINGVSKLPKAEKQGELRAQVGSYDRKVLAADVTGPLSEDGKLLYRLVALKRDSGTQVDYVDDNGYVFAPSLTWLPSDDTTISLLFNSQENTGAVSAQFLPTQGTLEPGPQGDIGSETFVGEPDWDRYDRRKDEVTLFVDHHCPLYRNRDRNPGALGQYRGGTGRRRYHRPHHLHGGQRHRDLQRGCAAGRRPAPRCHPAYPGHRCGSTERAVDRRQQFQRDRRRHRSERL